MIGSRTSGVALLAAFLLAVVLVACGKVPPPVGGTAERNGLVLETRLRATAESLVVETLVSNQRAEPIHLVPDQCGRITEVTLGRTVFEPEGEQWEGSVQAVKELILRDQLSRQRPDRFHPRIAGSDSTDPPGCERPEQPVTLEADGEIVERWELPFDITSARVLRAVGSSGSVVRAEVVEARDRNELEFLDIYSTGAPEAAEARRGRAVWVETPAEAVVKRQPDAQPAALSLGQLFDRLMEDAELRAWIEAQPADGWRHAALTPTFAALGDVEEQHVELRLITAEYERAALVSARHDGGGAELQLPGEEWRTRAFERRAATLPPGIRLIDEPDGYTPSDDLLLGELMLPSGRIAVGEFLFDEEELEIVVAAGSYPVHATLARYQGQEHDNVALATLILSPRQTVRWELAYTFPVDGGTATFVSAEGRDLLSGQLDADESAWRALDQEVFDSMMAHDYLGTEWQVDGGLNLVRVSSGVGDGGYPVYVGFDAGGQPTMVVVDFYLLHLAWPSG